MKNLLALVILLPFMTAASGGDCGSSSGCSGSTEPCPDIDIAGTWDFEFNSTSRSVEETGEAILQLNSSASGTYTAGSYAFAVCDSLTGCIGNSYNCPSGSVNGSKNGDNVVIRFNCGKDHEFSGTIISRDRMEGTGWHTVRM